MSHTPESTKSGTLRCSPTLHFTFCRNKEYGCPYHYDNMAIPYKALEWFEFVLPEKKYNFWSHCEWKDCCGWKTLLKRRPEAEWEKTPEEVEMCTSCRDWRVEPRVQETGDKADTGYGGKE